MLSHLCQRCPSPTQCGLSVHSYSYSNPSQLHASHTCVGNLSDKFNTPMLKMSRLRHQGTINCSGSMYSNVFCSVSCSCRTGNNVPVLPPGVSAATESEKCKAASHTVDLLLLSCDYQLKYVYYTTLR